MQQNPTLSALGLKPLSEIRAESVEETEVQFEEAEVTEVTVYEGSDQLPAVPEPDKELLDDIDFAKNNIKTILEQGADGLTEILSIAKQTESPQAFMAATGIMKALLEANRELINTAKEKKFEKQEQPAQHTTNNVTNNNLVLSTADLLEMLKGGK